MKFVAVVDQVPQADVFVAEIKDVMAAVCEYVDAREFGMAG